MPDQTPAPEVLTALPPRGGSQHDWEHLLDGTARKLLRGVHYDCDEQAMATRAWQAAKRRGLRVTVRYSRALGHVCIQRLDASA